MRVGCAPRARSTAPSATSSRAARSTVGPQDRMEPRSNLAGYGSRLLGGGGLVAVAVGHAGVAEVAVVLGGEGGGGEAFGELAAREGEGEIEEAARLGGVAALGAGDEGEHDGAVGGEAEGDVLAARAVL